VFAQVGDEVDFVVRYPWINLYGNDSPATAPENCLDGP